MARAASEKVGRGTCPMHGCGEPVTYRKSSGGLLTWRCDGCDSSGFMDARGSAYSRSLDTIKADPDGKPSTPGAPPELPASINSAPQKRKGTEAKPPEAAKRGAFSLEGL
jgi:hypothetical protein